MKLRFINSLLILCSLMAPCTGCARDYCSFAPHSNSAPIVPEGFGINIHFTDPRPGELKMLSEAGFRWVRMDLKWDLTEAEKGKYDFAPYDRLMAALDQYGLRALFILDYANPLYDKGAPPHTAEARQAFADWAVAAGKHFAGRDVIWETYNEPNIAQFWPPRPNVEDYVALALAVGRAFRERVPNEKLVGPATSGIDFDFLERCFKAGLLEYWSAVSVHPYRRSDPETAAQDYCRLRAMIETYAPVRTLSSGDGAPRVDGDSERAFGGNGAAAKKAIPILSGEWGYSSTWRDLNDDKQGQLLARQWLTNAANGIALSIWYDWQDDGSNANEPEHHFGTVYNSYHEGRESVFDPKPAYLAAKTLTTFLRGYQFEKRQQVGGNDDYVFVFRKADEVRIAAWTTASRAHRIVIPLAPALYQSMTGTGQSGTIVQADQNGLALDLTEAPLYLSKVLGKVRTTDMLSDGFYRSRISGFLTGTGNEATFSGFFIVSRLGGREFGKSGLFASRFSRPRFPMTASLPNILSESSFSLWQRSTTQ